MVLIRLFVFIIITLILSVVQAQSPVLSDENPIISPENVGQVEQLAMLGRGYPYEVAYSPDGKLFAVGATIGVWVYSGDDVTAPPRLLWDKTQKGNTLDIAFSPDGRFIAAGTGGEFPESGDNALLVWDVQSGQVIHHLLGHTSQIADVAYSPDGQFIATVTLTDGLFIWDAHTGELSRQMGNINNLVSVAYSPDGQFIATGTYHDVPERNIVFIRSVQTGETIQTFQHISLSLEYSPDGQFLASAWEGVRVWDAQTGEEIANFPYEDYINDVEFSPDGQSLAVATYNNAVDIYDVATMTRLDTIKAFENLTNSVAYHPNGGILATSNTLNERALRWWDAETYELVHEDVFNAFLNTAIFASDSQSILYSEDFRIGKLEVANLLTYQPLSDDHTFISLDQSNYYQSVSWLIASPYGLIAASQHDQGITVWDSQTGKVVYDILPITERLSRGAFHPYRHWLTALDDGDLHVWDMETGDLIQTIALDEPINSFAYDTNDDRLVLATYSINNDLYDATVYVYDTVSWTQMSISIYEGMTSSLKLDAVPNGRVVWSTHLEGDNTLIHDIDSEAEMILASDSYISELHFSPDSRLILAETGFDFSLWDYETGEKLATLQGHTDWAFSEWSPDGRAIISASGDGTIRVWGVPNE